MQTEELTTDDIEAVAQDLAHREPATLTPADIEARQARLAELMESERKKFVAMAARSTGPEDAEDVVQGAFLSAWESVHTCRDLSAMKAWLHVVFRRYATRHIAVAIERRNQVDLDSTPELGDSRNPYDPEKRLLMQELREEAEALTDKGRAAVLAHLDGADISQCEHKRRYHGITTMREHLTGPNQLLILDKSELERCQIKPAGKPEAA